jgi:dihydroorotate dehydrogenase electron transfer subunit
MTTLAAVPPRTIPVPAAAPAEYDAVIVSNEAVNDEYRLMTLDVPEPATRAVPGQFYHLLCPQKGELQPFFRRPMSIYRIEPDKGRLSFLYKVTGTGTRAMALMDEGETFNIFGPLGVGFSLPANRAPIVVLGRGVGLATMAPLVPYARERGHPVTAILSARSPQVLMSVDEMRDNGADVLTVTDLEGTSDVELVENMLHLLYGQKRLGGVYVCGSNRLMLAAQRVARRLGIFGEVALEQQMACGVGMCFCCVRPFREGDDVVHRRVCCEGPVFPLLEAMQW